MTVTDRPSGALNISPLKLETVFVALKVRYIDPQSRRVQAFSEQKILFSHI